MIIRIHNNGGVVVGRRSSSSSNDDDNVDDRWSRWYIVPSNIPELQTMKQMMVHVKVVVIVRARVMLPLFDVVLLFY